MFFLRPASSIIVAQNKSLPFRVEMFCRPQSMVVAVSSPSMVTLTGAIVRTRYKRAAAASGYRNNGAERAGNFRANFFFLLAPKKWVLFLT